MITNRQRSTAEKLASILTAQELDILVDAMAALDLPSLEKVHLFKEVDTVVSEAFAIALHAEEYPDGVYFDRSCTELDDLWS